MEASALNSDGRFMGQAGDGVSEESGTRMQEAGPGGRQEL